MPSCDIGLPPDDLPGTTTVPGPGKWTTTAVRKPPEAESREEDDELVCEFGQDLGILDLHSRFFLIYIKTVAFWDGAN